MTIQEKETELDRLRDWGVLSVGEHYIARLKLRYPDIDESILERIRKIWSAHICI